MLSRSSENRLQRWAMRSAAAFLVVYMLGWFGVPTLIPYLAVLIASVCDAVRLALQRRTPRPRLPTMTDRGETIH